MGRDGTKTQGHALHLRALGGLVVNAMDTGAAARALQALRQLRRAHPPPAHRGRRPALRALIKENTTMTQAQSYEAWRITYQSDEQAARSAFDTAEMLRQELLVARAAITSLERDELKALTEHDGATDFIDKILDEVLGQDRHEWTSAYDWDDALADVEVRMAALKSGKCLHQIAEPAAQGLDTAEYRLIDHGELIEAGDEFLRDDFTWEIDPKGIFVGVPLGTAFRPARRALAAKAKQN
jgi:hypothetical protein